MRKLLLAVAVTVSIANPPAFAQEKEPTYEGKARGEWLKDLKDANPVIRSKAASALGFISPKATVAVPELLKALKDPDEKVRASAAFAVGCIRTDAKIAVPALLEGLKDKSDGVRALAAGALGLFKSEAALAAPALGTLLGDKQLEVRWQAAQALSKMGSGAKGATKALIAAVQVVPPAGVGPYGNIVQYFAIVALGNIGPEAKSAVPILLRALKDSDKEIREAARMSLRRIDPEAAKKAGVP